MHTELIDEIKDFQINSDIIDLFVLYEILAEAVFAEGIEATTYLKEPHSTAHAAIFIARHHLHYKCNYNQAEQALKLAFSELQRLCPQDRILRLEILSLLRRVCILQGKSDDASLYKLLLEEYKWPL